MRTSSDYVGIKAKALTPFYYHGLYAWDGSITAPNVITDTAFIFALRAALLSVCPALRSEPNYKADLSALPWRASLFMGENNTMMSPIHHIIDVSREGGFQENLRTNMGSGNFKNRFYVHEVAAGATYQGILCGIDPFKLPDFEAERFVIRVGVMRLGMLEISYEPAVKEVRLNTATAKLFGRSLEEEYRILDTIRVSKPFLAKKAMDELKQWI